MLPMSNEQDIAWLNYSRHGRCLAMNLQERVGQNIQHVRRGKGLSQEALAHAADISRSYMGKLENGKNSMSLTTLEKIADALGVDPNDLTVPRSHRK